MGTKKIVCTRCQLEMTVHSEQNSDLMIMACESCGSFLMSYGGEIFEVDEVEMKSLAANRMQEIAAYIDNDPHKHEHTEARPTHKIGTPVRNEYFGDTDLSDLKIDLAQVEDVMDFINRI